MLLTPTNRVESTYENVWRPNFYVQNNAEARPRTNIELNPTKPKMKPKKLDQIRSAIARVGNEPDYTSRHECRHKSRKTFRESHDSPPFWKSWWLTHLQYHDIVATPSKKGGSSDKNHFTVLYFALLVIFLSKRILKIFWSFWIIHGIPTFRNSVTNEIKLVYSMK